MIDFKEIITSKKNVAQNRIHEVLLRYQKLHPEYSIDWTNNECSEESFTEFSIHKLRYSMAYNECEVMLKEQAEDYFTQFLENFNGDCRYFTNWYNIEKERVYASEWTPVTKNTYDCALIVMDKDKTGVIILTDED